MATIRFTLSRSIALLLVLGGCAQLRWSGKKMDGTTATPEQVEMDRAQCTAQTYAGNPDALARLTVLTACMRGKGYLADSEVQP